MTTLGQGFAAPPELLVAAAADLANLQIPLEESFRRRSDWVRFVFGSSGLLARQIQNGAPYDVYLSANEQLVKELVASGLILPDSVKTYALGRIALWSRDGRVRGLRDLAKPEILHVALPNPAHAPYGVAARQALEKERLWDSMARRIVYGENVRQAFQYAESGNAEAVITAWSLVFNKGGILIDEKLHAPIRQAGGILKSARNPALAQRFLDFLTGEQGRELLRRYGLFPPD